MSTEDNKKLAMGLMTALGEKRFEDAENMLTEDFTWWAVGKAGGSGTRNKARFMKLLRSVQSYADGSYEFVSVIAEGNRVALEAEGRQMLKNGTPYRNNYVFLFEIRDGKIASGKEYMDTAYAIEVWGDGKSAPPS